VVIVTKARAGPYPDRHRLLHAVLHPQERDEAGYGERFLDANRTIDQPNPTRARTEASVKSEADVGLRHRRALSCATKSGRVQAI
jgi:hypothetical protein